MSVCLRKRERLRKSALLIFHESVYIIFHESVYIVMSALSYVWGTGVLGPFLRN